MSEKLEGNNIHRHEQNPEEKKFHDEFIQSYGRGDNMNHIAFGCMEGTDVRPKDYLTDREKVIMISTIQWLGSPVGQGFLDSMGYEKKNK